MAPGTAVKLSLIHDGQDKTVTLTLGTLPNEKQAANQQKENEVPDSDVPKLGLTLAPRSKVAGSDGSGVVVTAVDPNGVAADHGFRVGDVILDVSGKSVSSPADVRRQISEAQRACRWGALSIVRRFHLYPPKSSPLQRAPKTSSCQPSATSVFPNFRPNFYAIRPRHERA